MAKWFEKLEFVSFEVRNRVAYVTLNRPERRNALFPEFLTELNAVLTEADDLVDVSCIVLAGAGKDFCAGYDLQGIQYRNTSEQTSDQAGQYRRGSLNIDDDAWRLERMQRLVAATFDLHKPVIAKVHGNCLAGGTDLALWCDLIIASDEARIGFPATRANGSPPNHMWFYHLGPQWAKRLLFTGDCISGEDAARLGLVLESYPDSELDAAVERLAERIALVDTDLLSAHKRIVNIALELAGARTLGRMAAEIDAKAHLSQGPRKKQFDDDMAAHGLKTALTNRDAPFGDGMVRVRRR